MSPKARGVAKDQEVPKRVRSKTKQDAKNKKTQPKKAAQKAEETVLLDKFHAPQPKKAAQKAEETELLEKFRARSAAKKLVEQKATQKAAVKAERNEQVDPLAAARVARLHELNMKERAGNELTSAELDEIVSILEKTWQPHPSPTPVVPETPKPLRIKSGIGAKGKFMTDKAKGKGATHDKNENPTLRQEESGRKGFAKGKADPAGKSRSGRDASSIKSALDEQAQRVQGKAAVGIWDMEVCSFEDVTRAAYRPQGLKSWALVGIMDGSSGRKEFHGTHEGWRVTCKLRNKDQVTIPVVAFTENIWWLEEKAEMFRDQIVRMGPLQRKLNSYTGKMDIHLCPTTDIVSTTELAEHIAPFPELCGGWPTAADWIQEQQARLKAELVKVSDGEIEVVVADEREPYQFNVFGLHPALFDAKPGTALYIEVFPMTGGGEKISEHSIVRLA